MRKKRRHITPRCEHCGLHLPLCVCPHLPSVVLPWRWILTQHGVEVDRPTNTGRMILKLFPETERILYARRDVELDTSPLAAADTDYLLMFPGEGARVLTPELLRPSAGRRLAIVLLDGTWRQASHMAHRIAPLRSIPLVRLPDGPTSHWAIRIANEAHQLCTLEAAILAVQIAGRAADARRLRIAMEWIQLRMLYMKGRLPRPPDRSEAESNVEAFSP